VFGQAKFLPGKPELLKYITRNQKKGAKEEKKTPALEEKKEVKQDFVMQIITEIGKIQCQQLDLESMLVVLDKKKQKVDLSAQMMMSSFYHK
jgi:hypothetical protein